MRSASSRQAVLALVVGAGLVLPVAHAEALVTSESSIATVAGSTVGFAGDGGPAELALLNAPRDSDVGPDGSIYLVDTGNNRIRKVGTDGIITTVAGTGSNTYNGDGIPATQASLSLPHDVVVDGSGAFYVADTAHHRIRRVDAGGVITTIAGNGLAGSSGDGGPATAARIRSPKSVVLQGGGLFFSSTDNKVRRVDLDTSIITTVAGTGIAGYTGDGGPATQATLSAPQRIQVDSLGNLYIADKDNSVVRRVDAATGIITTAVGTGVSGNSGNGGPATEAKVNHPRGLELENDTTLYIADSGNNQVRRVDLVTGIITHVAGTTSGFGGDGGPAGQAQLCLPRGLTSMPDGDLLVADSCNNRFRRIDTAAAPVPPGPAPPVQLFTNSSVESSGAGYMGTFSPNDQVTWTAEGGGVDGMHAMRIVNVAAAAQDAGLTNNPATVTQTVRGNTYTGSVWVRSTQPNQKVVLRLRECNATCITDVAVVTLTDPGWREISNTYVAQTDGGVLNYAVAAKTLPASVPVYADLFSMTRQAPR